MSKKKFPSSSRSGKSGSLHLAAALALIGVALPPNPLQAQTVPSDEAEQLDEFVGFAGEDPVSILPTEPIESAVGFSKTLLETPRSISTVSSEIIDRLGLSAVEDLARIVPGTYTTTRFGIQGSINVRSVPADTYFRGMKRLNLQGHARTVLAALDSIEVVKGPPSPIYGMGKIGGYTNMVPKSGRAKVGGYLEKSEGFVQAIVGSYDRKEVSFGTGGPVELFGKKGGFYVYGLLEDSDSYTEQVFVKQKILQAALSLDNVIGKMRMETGLNYQVSGTAGAFMNRVSQELVDDGRYITGRPLVNLDLNGNGKIGYLEYMQASPVRGNLSGANQPLIQQFAWPRDANGNLYPLGQFPARSGIPVTMLNYLNANPEADPTGLLRAQGAGGVLPTSGQLPVGFVLDPRTVGETTVDYRRAGNFEKELEAKLGVFYLDFIQDSDPSLTFKNQTFVDNMDQYKLSEQPGGGKQDVTVVENKTTVTKLFEKLPDWLDLNTLGSFNFRWTRATGYRYGGDFSGYRTDVMDGQGLMTPNTTFVHPFENDDILNDGAPWTSDYKTDYWETGIGLMADITIADRLNLLLGARYDGSHAENTDNPSFNPTSGTSANPGRPRAQSSASGWDTGLSWSVSASYALPYNIRPYITLAESSLTLETNNNKMDNNVIRNGHIGQAELKEAGIKANLLDGKLFLASAIYEQTRTSVSISDDSSLLNAEVSSTKNRGWETEIKWVPTRNFSLSAFALFQKTEYIFNRGANIWVDARTLGFQDGLDANGNVVYPAEAFLYGGRSFLILPAGTPGFEEVHGTPNEQFGFTALYDFDFGLGLSFSGNFLSSTYSGRLKTIRLPASEVFNIGASYKFGQWRAKLDVFNLLDEQYFRARTGDTLGDALFSAMPGRRWQLTVTRSF